MYGGEQYGNLNGSLQEEIEYLHEDEVDIDESGSEEDLEDYQGSSDGDGTSSSGEDDSASEVASGNAAAENAERQGRPSKAKRKSGEHGSRLHTLQLSKGQVRHYAFYVNVGAVCC